MSSTSPSPSPSPSSFPPGVGSAEQHSAARNLIAQLVKNSDVYEEDEAEQRRLQTAAADGTIEPNQQSQPQAPAQPASAASNLAHFDNYAQVTDELLDEWKEMFSLFDFDSTGFILSDDLGTVLRGLGHNLTEEAVSTFINTFDATASGQMDFPTFYQLMCQHAAEMPGPCQEEQVLEDFKVFDMHREGHLPVQDLVHLLRNLGEPLTRDDVDHLLQEIYIDGDNRVHIKDLVQHMFRTSAPNAE